MEPPSLRAAAWLLLLRVFFFLIKKKTFHKNEGLSVM